jgi:hypothetical protein
MFNRGIFRSSGHYGREPIIALEIPVRDKVKSFLKVIIVFWASG